MAWVERLIRCRMVAQLFALLGALPLFAAALYGLVVFQRAYIPVVVDFNVTRFERLHPARIEIWGDMTKRFEYGDGLPLCRYDGMQWWAENLHGLAEAQWTTLERPLGQTVNRQPGRQMFGPWIVDYSMLPDAAELYGVVSHTCMGFWKAETKLGPLDIRPGNAWSQK